MTAPAASLWKSSSQTPIYVWLSWHANIGELQNYAFGKAPSVEPNVNIGVIRFAAALLLPAAVRTHRLIETLHLKVAVTSFIEDQT